MVAVERRDPEDPFGFEDMPAWVKVVGMLGYAVVIAATQFLVVRSGAPAFRVGTLTGLPRPPLAVVAVAGAYWPVFVGVVWFIRRDRRS